MTTPWRVAVLLAGLLSMDCRAADPFREAELAGALASRYGGEETVWLNVDGQRFPALLRESMLKQSLGSVVLLHGIEESPDAPNFIQGLRKALAERGWTSLSLQAPMREAGAGFHAHSDLMAEAVRRLGAGIAYLNEKKATPVAIVGHRAGALMAIRYLAQNQGATTRAVVLVNMPDAGTGETDQDMEKLAVPVLDIITAAGSRRDNDWTAKRKRLMKNNDGYRQVALADAGADLRDVQGMLINRIHGWLKREMMPADHGKTE